MCRHVARDFFSVPKKYSSHYLENSHIIINNRLTPDQQFLRVGCRSDVPMSLGFLPKIN